MAKELLEEGELSRRQDDRTVTQPGVAREEVDRQRGKCTLARGDTCDRVAVGPQSLLQERSDSILVLDEQELHRGSLIQKVEPRPGLLSTPALPSCASAIPRTMASPRPVPFDEGPCRNGSNIMN